MPGRAWHCFRTRQLFASDLCCLPSTTNSSEPRDTDSYVGSGCSDQRETRTPHWRIKMAADISRKVGISAEMYFTISTCGRVVRCRTCDREVAGSNPALGCCVPTPTQRAIPPGRLMSTSESWGVNGHTTRCTGPVSVVLRLRLVFSWGLRKRRSAPAHGP